MLYILAATLKDGQVDKFHAWAGHAEKRFAAASPRGWRFKGIFLTSFGLGPSESEIHWEIDNFAAFDAAVDTHGSNGDYAKVVGEYFSHVSAGSQRGRVLRAATDAKLQLVRNEGLALAL
jgi:hypothetical protein